jgi:hypothetical protein
MIKKFPQIEREHGLFEVTIDSNHLAIIPQDIGRLLGYVHQQIPEHFEQMIREILLRLSGVCEIRAGFRVVDVTWAGQNDGMHLGGVFFQLQKIVTSQLRSAETAALFACTIGPGMEEWRRVLEKDHDEVRAHLVDTIASAAVEKATDLLHDQIQGKMFQQGFGVTNRFSPGYCGWSVVEQQILFSLLPDVFCGITLTESSLMVPMKSVSGIIGIGPNAKREGYLCGRCERNNCLYRESHREDDAKK